MITVDSIIEDLERRVAGREAIGPHNWLNACQTLIVLLGNESDRLFEIQHAIAIKKAEYISNGDTAAKAKIKAEALPEYMEAQKLKSKIDRVIEMVRISKIQARTKENEYNAN